jgi:molecular chaperone IbpA
MSIHSGDLDRMVKRFNEMAVGFGPIFKDFGQSAGNNYPPHNIVILSDNKFNLELAIAGFKRDEVQVTEKNGELTITADKKTEDAQTYQYRGIANRSFSKTFRIAEYFEISGAKMADGILVVSFVKNAPEPSIKTIVIK